MMSFFREQKLLAAILILSFLVLGVGLCMVQLTKEQTKVEDQLVDEHAKTIAVMSLMAEVAEQELTEQQGQVALQGVGDIKPQESFDRVAALNGRVPDIGSDDWCEVMMVKDAKDWTLDEQSLFAKHCL